MAISILIFYMYQPENPKLHENKTFNYGPNSAKMGGHSCLQWEPGFFVRPEADFCSYVFPMQFTINSSKN